MQKLECECEEPSGLMPMELVCWRCHQPFDADKQDIRPYVYHTCPDGVITAQENPYTKQSKRYIPLKANPQKRKLTSNHHLEEF